MIHISNPDKGCMSRGQKIAAITEALYGLSEDILTLIYKIVFYAESGLE